MAWLKMGYSQRMIKSIHSRTHAMSDKKRPKHSVCVCVWNVIKFTSNPNHMLLLWASEQLKKTEHNNNNNIYQPQDFNAIVSSVCVFVSVWMLSCNSDYIYIQCMCVWSNGIGGFWIKPLKDYSSTHLPCQHTTKPKIFG